MALYLIGDLQGCSCAFKQLLKKLAFSPSRDHLILLGDLVNRGPDSKGTLDAIIALEGAVTCLLGNHDIHLLGVAYGIRKVKHLDTINDILDSPKKQFYIDWLRQQHMALYQHGWLMVHAGIAPQWDLEQTLICAHEMENVLRAPDLGRFIHELFGDQPNLWSPELKGFERIRFTCNTLTRIRFCYADGSLNFTEKNAPKQAAAGLIPWFDFPQRQTANTPIAFGHWSTLGFTDKRPYLLALDTGCLWGGQLTAAKISPQSAISGNNAIKLIQIQCAQSLDPFSTK